MSAHLSSAAGLDPAGVGAEAAICWLPILTQHSSPHPHPHPVLLPLWSAGIGEEAVTAIVAAYPTPISLYRAAIVVKAAC